MENNISYRLYVTQVTKEKLTVEDEVIVTLEEISEVFHTHEHFTWLIYCIIHVISYWVNE